MKAKHYFLSLICCLTVHLASAQEVITNESVIQMLELFFDYDLLID